ncbi:hypothetical protein [Pedobacter frigoris]|uniref:DUF4129 domain-containing protein n=1 Tax=Pedobacter frigoris TaxID=2571272 RepID=A0A4U1CMJ6_9SPHI|nr:hypothetical protein [Pedobacter frigoris]TKC07601.1 hypothetical protein FA047_10200 [Pedobacter frigoris]
MRTLILFLKNINMRFLLSAFLLFVSLQIRAVDKPGTLPSHPAVVKTDSSKVALRSFDAKKLNSFKASKDFQYDDVPPQQESLWDRFWRWFWSLISRLFSNIHSLSGSGSFIKYLAITVFFALVVFAVIKIIGADLAIFSKKSKAIQIPYYETDDNIHEINFNEEIDKAISSGNYRLAVRLLYLLSLKQLNDKSLIHWLPEKTNQTYLSEIKDENNRIQFSTLTRQFEYIWYGEFMISKDNFTLVKNSFEQFNSQIS